MTTMSNVELTSIVIKCFEQMVKTLICSFLPAALNPLQFAYRANRSTDDVITLALHTALNHLEAKKNYVRMLFIDYSSAFNTIIPTKLVTKLKDLGLNSHLCNWILDFLIGGKKLAASHPPLSASAQELPKSAQSASLCMLCLHMTV